jgi:predicted HTH transcriptional regulator
VDSRPFIDFMLDVMANSLHKYIDVATRTVDDGLEPVPVNVGANVGVSDQILAALAHEPRLSAKQVAGLLSKNTRTIERQLKALREQGRIQRVGSDKTGHWQIIERSA